MQDANNAKEKKNNNKINKVGAFTIVMIFILIFARTLFDLNSIQCKFYFRHII